MQKPINKVALWLWIAAVAVAVLDVMSIGETVRTANMSFQGDNKMFLFPTIIRLAGNIIMPVATLVGIGYLIELVDRMLWNTRPPKAP